MKVSEYDYKLPEELIAKHPPKQRGTSRLMVLDKHTGLIAHKRYKNLADYISPGDLVILNDTKVIKARLVATNQKGQPRELLLLEDHHNTDFKKRKALYRGKLHTGEKLKVGSTAINVDDVLTGGIAQISSQSNLLDLAEKAGSVPLPPYMHRQATRQDTERYQTVFAREPGSVAAPTASLNFTKKLQEKIKAKGASIAYLTLHVGLGTFLPIRADNLENHKMHSEYFEIPSKTAAAILATKTAGNKIFAIGTTVARTLEFAASELLPEKAAHHVNLTGEADIFIYPGYEFKIVDALLTNFHAPKTTVLMLAAAFADWEYLKHAYEQAVEEKYTFLSYGDSMLIC